MTDVGERREQIEQRPGDNHVVIDADEAVDDELAEPDAWSFSTPNKRTQWHGPHGHAG